MMLRARVLVFCVLALAVVSSGGRVEALPPNPCTPVNMHPNAQPGGVVGQPYHERVWLTPANPHFTIWQVTPPVPIPGVALVPGPGAEEAFLDGVPTTPGTYTFTVDAGGVFVLGTICWRSKTYTVTIQ